MSSDTPWLDLRHDERTTLKAAVDVLHADGVIVAPTETVYGLMCRWDCSQARERIFRMKRRATEKPLQMLTGGLAAALRAGVVEEPRLQRLAAAFWPGPLTVVAVGGRGETIGVRVPRHALVLALVQALGEPLAATSANLSGEPPARSALEAVARLAEMPDLIIDGGPVPPDAGTPSTVVDLSVPGDIRILREGPITEAALRRVLAAAPSV